MAATLQNHRPRGSAARIARSLALGAFLGIGPFATTAPAQRADGARPGNLRLPLLEVTGERVAEQNPVAKLARQADKLALDEPQRAALDSIASDLGGEVQPFIVRIDSLVEARRQMAERADRRPRGITRADDEPEPRPAPNPLLELWHAVAQVNLRYEAAMLSVARVLTDAQWATANRLVAKEQERMARWTGTPGAGRGPMRRR